MVNGETLTLTVIPRPACELRDNKRVTETPMHKIRTLSYHFRTVIGSQFGGLGLPKTRTIPKSKPNVVKPLPYKSRFSLFIPIDL